jgi:hypothetical protein
VNTFVGPACDLGHDSVLARIYPMLSVAQHACPWARPECLPLFLQFLVFGAEGPRDQSDSAALVAYFSVLRLCGRALRHFFANPVLRFTSWIHSSSTTSRSHCWSSCEVRPIRASTWARFPSIVLSKLLTDGSPSWVRICAILNTANASLPFAEFQAGAMEAEKDSYGRLYGNPLPRTLCGSAVQPF